MNKELELFKWQVMCHKPVSKVIAVSVKQLEDVFKHIEDQQKLILQLEKQNSNSAYKLVPRQLQPEQKAAILAWARENAQSNAWPERTYEIAVAAAKSSNS